MDIKWTAGPGPAPLPYSKRAREAMGYSDDDKPWAHPDPPTAESLGFGGDSLREGRLRTNLFVVVMLMIAAIWVYRKFVKRDRDPFFYVAPNASQEKVSEEDLQIAREARLKRFQEQKTSYADIMKEAAGGWSPGDEGAAGGDGAASSEGLRHRGGNQGH